MNAATRHGFHSSNHPRKFNTTLNWCLKCIPWVTFLLTIILFLWTVWILVIQGTNIFLFLLLSAKMYLNWFAVFYSRGKFDSGSIPKSTTVEKTHVSVQRVWFCTKCKMDTFYECHHCPLCNVCIIQRDHHCFFLGTCVTRQNMKHFIVFCVYAALSCFYTGTTLINTLTLPHPTYYFLPVCIGYFLSGSLSLPILTTVLTINVILSTGFLTLCFGVYQISVICLARLPYSSDLDQRNSYLTNFLNIFDGPNGLLNFLFPVTVFAIKKKSLILNKSV